MFSNIFTVSKDHETMETKLFICTDLQIKHKIRMLTRMVNGDEWNGSPAHHPVGISGEVFMESGVWNVPRNVRTHL